jgi:hypothetical protein
MTADTAELMERRAFLSNDHSIATQLGIDVLNASPDWDEHTVHPQTGPKPLWSLTIKMETPKEMPFNNFGNEPIFDAPRRTMDWVRPVAKKLDELLSLPQNWDSYGAPKIADSVVPTVIGLLQDVMLPTTPIPQIFPTSSGGVQLEWHQNGVDLEIEIDPHDFAHVHFVCENSVQSEEFEGEASTHQKELAEQIRFLSNCK